MNDTPPTDARSARSPVVCAGCGCFCDDIGADITDEGVTRATNACPAGEEWLRRLPASGLRCFAKGASIAPTEAARETATCLQNAQAPVVVALLDHGVEAFREIDALAETAGADFVLLPEISLATRRSGIDAPELSATWGEVRATADTIILWRCDPLLQAPRFLDRFVCPPHAPTGAPELPDGRSRRLVYVTNPDAPEPSLPSGTTILCGLDGVDNDVDLVRHLRLRLREDHDSASSTSTTLDGLLKALTTTQHTHVLLDPTSASTPPLWSAWQSLAAEQRARRRISISGLPSVGNVRGALEVLTWRHGHLPPRRAGLPLPPNVSEDGALATLSDYDLIVLFGSAPAAMHAKVLAASPARRISVGAAADPDATLAVETASLDPRVASTVIRADGIGLRTCGERDGISDGVVDFVREVRRRLPPPTEGRAPLWNDAAYGAPDGEGRGMSGGTA